MARNRTKIAPPSAVDEPWIGTAVAVLGALGTVGGVLSSLGLQLNILMGAVAITSWVLLIPLLIMRRADQQAIGRLRWQVDLLHAERREDREAIAADRIDRASLIAVLAQSTAARPTEAAKRKRRDAPDADQAEEE